MLIILEEDMEELNHKPLPSELLGPLIRTSLEFVLGESKNNVKRMESYRCISWRRLFLTVFTIGLKTQCNILMGFRKIAW